MLVYHIELMVMAKQFYYFLLLVFQIGMTELAGQESVKVFCTKCQNVYSCSHLSKFSSVAFKCQYIFAFDRQCLLFIRPSIHRLLHFSLLLSSSSLAPDSCGCILLRSHLPAPVFHDVLASGGWGSEPGGRVCAQSIWFPGARVQHLASLI